MISTLSYQITPLVLRCVGTLHSQAIPATTHLAAFVLIPVTLRGDPVFVVPFEVFRIPVLSSELQVPVISNARAREPPCLNSGRAIRVLYSGSPVKRMLNGIASDRALRYASV